MIPSKRILTYRSKLGFGKWSDYSVEQLLKLGKIAVLIPPYYKLSSITYTEEILIELGITEQYRIEKPSINKEMYSKFVSETKALKIRTNQKMPMQPFKNLTFSNNFLQYLNHK